MGTFAGYSPSPEMAALIKQKLFGNWDPEDQEWGLQEFIKDGNVFNGHFQTLEKAEAALKSGDSATAEEWLKQGGDRWFSTQGHAKTKARNEERDAKAKQVALDEEAAAAQGRTNTINTQLDEFYRQLSQPIDPNDPEIVRVASKAGRGAATDAYGRGIEGGAAYANTERTAGAAAADMFQRERERRDGLRAQVGGLRATGAMSQQDFHSRQQQIADANRQYEQGLRYQDQMDQYNAGMQGAQGLGGIVGGVLGALPGLIPGVGPALMKYTLPAGMQMGAGAGGLMYGRRPPRRSYGSYWGGA